MNNTHEQLTIKNVEQANNHPELVNYVETETKLFVTNPDVFAHYRDQAVPIEQYYLSTPDDEFSLRVRKQFLPDGPMFTADLKDRGHVRNNAIERIEIPVRDLSEEAYEFYAHSPDAAPLVQYRAFITDEMTIDFIDNFEYPIIEIETDNPERRAELLQQLEGVATNVTESGLANKELIAHTLNTTEKNRNRETLDMFTDRVIAEMVAHYVSGKNRVVVGLTGMPGSGKTTVTNRIKSKLNEYFGEAFEPVVVSTDDYHRGKTKLEAMNGGPWTAWDDPLTYDTAELARDLALMAQGHSLIRRHFDFETEEPVLDGEVTPAPFVIVEGLYAGSKELQEVRDLHFELPSSVATSIGRDIRRLVIEGRANRVFPTPESRLKYQLETALPLYLSQERPRRNGFSGCARSMASRAFMLQRIRQAESELTQQ
jgi:uridine kinase